MKGRRESHHVSTGVLSSGELDRLYDARVVDALRTEEQVAAYVKTALAEAGNSTTRIALINDIANQARERIRRAAKYR